MKRAPKVRRQVVRGKQVDADKRRRVEELLLAGGGAMSYTAVAQATGTSTPFVGSVYRSLVDRLEQQLGKLRRPLTATNRLLTVNSPSNSTTTLPNLQQILTKASSRTAPIPALEGAGAVNSQKNAILENRSAGIDRSAGVEGLSAPRVNAAVGPADCDVHGRPYPWSGFGEKPNAGSTGNVNVIDTVVKPTGSQDVLGASGDRDSSFDTGSGFVWTGLRYMSGDERRRRLREYEEREQVDPRDWDPYRD